MGPNKNRKPIVTLNADGKHDNFELVRCINKIGTEVLIRRDDHEHQRSWRQMYVEEAGFLVVDDYDTPEKKKLLETEIKARKQAAADAIIRTHLSSPAGRAAVNAQAAVLAAAREQAEAVQAAARKG
jgi:hypothetical protein